MNVQAALLYGTIWVYYILHELSNNNIRIKIEHIAITSQDGTV